METELRAKLENPVEILKSLNKMGVVFEKPILQIDRYFRREGEKKNLNQPGNYVLRVRTSKQNYLTIKIATKKINEWEEYETKIDSPKDLIKILEKLGFLEELVVKKKRAKGILENFEINLDEIENLGTFLEIEALNLKNATKELQKILKSLGIPSSSIEKRGYVQLMKEMQLNK